MKSIADSIHPFKKPTKAQRERHRLPAFILSYKRAENVKTAGALRKAGYTGDIYIVCDDTDDTVPRYKEVFGEDKVIVFNKAIVRQHMDVGDNFPDMRAVVFARHASHVIAKAMGYSHYMQLDDDYTSFWHMRDGRGAFKKLRMTNLDKVLDAMLDYAIAGNFDAFAPAQGGDFIGGKDNTYTRRNWMLIRKTMQLFIIPTAKPLRWAGRMNEDVSTYICGGLRGGLFGSVPMVDLEQPTTQAVDGGMSEIYREQGTYVKTFYSIMQAPSCMRVAEVGTAYRRLHHRTNWNNAVPKILDEKYRKRSS